MPPKPKAPEALRELSPVALPALAPKARKRPAAETSKAETTTAIAMDPEEQPPLPSESEVASPQPPPRYPSAGAPKTKSKVCLHRMLALELLLSRCPRKYPLPGLTRPTRRSSAMLPL